MADVLEVKRKRTNTDLGVAERESSSPRSPSLGSRYEEPIHGSTQFEPPLLPCPTPGMRSPRLLLTDEYQAQLQNIMVRSKPPKSTLVLDSDVSEGEGQSEEEIKGGEN